MADELERSLTMSLAVMECLKELSTWKEISLQEAQQQFVSGAATFQYVTMDGQKVYLVSEAFMQAATHNMLVNKLHADAPEVAEAARLFHAHLGSCQQCANSPFDLCPIGQELIRSVSAT